MQFNIRNILLLATAVAALPTVIKRDATTVLNNLKAIDTSTKSLTASENAFTGSVTGALAINTAATNLDTQLKSAASEAKTEPVSSSADSKSIIAYLTGTLTPDIQASLNALVAKKAQFQSSGLLSVAQTTLKTLQTDSGALSTNLVAIASADQKANAQAAAKVVATDFANAVAAFA